MELDNPSFKPAWWLPGPHLQTLWPTLCRRQIKHLQIKHERFELPDGDFVDLAWAGEKGPIVLILHGLEGSIHSSYAQGMLYALTKQKLRGVLMHFRGCSTEPNRLPRSYHAGETNDVNILMHALRKREPHTPFAAIGFSLGGNVLLKWLGETGHYNPLQAAIAISVPFELQKSVNRLKQGFSRLYQWHLLNCLRNRITHQFQHPNSLVDITHLQQLNTLEDFDEHVTAPLHGFINAVDYYNKASSRQYLAKIHVPTLLIQSKDDPLMTEDSMPSTDELSTKISLEITEKGGHVGFITGKYPWHPCYWLEQRALLFLHRCGIL